MIPNRKDGTVLSATGTGITRTYHSTCRTGSTSKNSTRVQVLLTTIQTGS
jgi:hypothetical protein